jgi:hypothetical protein
MPRWPCLVAVLVATPCLLACSGEARLGIAEERDSRETWKIVECADFDFDGLADVLWYSPTKHAISVWRMGGTEILGRGPEIAGPRGPEWEAVPVNEDSADFDFDQMADVLWHNPATNLVTVWAMRGTQVVQEGRELEGPSDRAGWDLGVVGDFDGDGMSGLLWHNERERSAFVWTVTGTNREQAGASFPAPSGPGWVPAASFDYNGDFASDVLWYNASRNVIAVWLMAGTRVLEEGPEIAGPSGGGWVPVGASDLNGDTLADVVWSNPARNVIEPWLMAGTTVLEKGPEIAGPSGGGWTLPALADFNHDGLSDVVWLDRDAGRFAVWLMQGIRVLEAGPVLEGP